MYHTFYTLSDLNYAIFNFVVVYFLLTIKDKKYNVYNLTFLFFILGTMALSYFFSFGLTEKYWAYHRWFTVGISLVGTAQLSNFLFHYPEKKWKILPKIVFLYHTIGLSITAAFVYKSISAPKIYHFDGHFWDVDLPLLSKIIGLAILLLMILAVITGYTKAILEKKGNRLPLFYVTTGFIFIILIPGITNFLNRLYLIQRDFHHNFWVLSGILGTFIVLTTYVNYTKEKTTLLTKIYAVSIASILVIMQFSSYFILKEREKFYDVNQNYKSGRIIKDESFRPDDLLAYGKIDNNLRIIGLYHRDDKQNIEELYNEGEVVLQKFRKNIKRGEDITKGIPEGLKGYIGGYIKWYNALKLEGKSNEEILEEMYKNRNKILLLRKLISELPDKGFEERYKKEIYEKRKMKDVEKYFIESIGIGKSKREILEKIPIMYQSGERFYRYIERLGGDFWSKSYVLYFYDVGDELYFVVYRYKEYREFIDEVSRVLLNIVLISTLLILLSYPIFFYLSVIRPLRRLVNGLEEVDRGNLNVYIDVYVEDELGYVTRSFNKMVDSIRAKNRELEDYATRLEEKVKERTRDLERSLQEIEKLKEKQDGDYFLTSLLLKPLNINEVGDDGVVKVGIKIEQYKKFQFRHWASEIGGDLCSAYKIGLREKEYIFCVNADAMGKSMQGAGGSLVLGSVLEAIVERTRYDSAVRDQYPELWLKKAFVELHRVFESFDGSMLVSCILLLVDKREGCVYHINAEHPNLILYRDGEAVFIEPRKPLMKLGVSVEGLLEIGILRLKEGDRLIMGSDGKDDLVLGIEDGVRKINDDEGLFLEVVKESGGDIELIYGNLKERGEFMDDVSLLLLEYRGDSEWLKRSRYMNKEDKERYDEAISLLDQGEYIRSSEILRVLKEEYKDNGVIRKRLGYVLLKLGKYREGLKELEYAMELLPWDSEILKILSKSYFRLGDFERASEFGEIYILRESEDKEMIKHLKEVYEKIKESGSGRMKEFAEGKIKKYEKYL
ncbi:MAG: serine phosphatase [Leptospiraceae bacterium]|nr:MAG: serine phosphatase [Leptospiraceae bacterium]